MKNQQKKKLFCERSPLAYQLAVWKCQIVRGIRNILLVGKLAKSKSQQLLPVVVYSHRSLIRRKLGNVDPVLQENKAVNLSLAAPKITGIIIRPGEIFSLWSLVGSCTKAKGYKEGLTICKGKPSKGIGGGMCQLSNLIHWMVLHTPLEIVEHHHHDGVDLFPDYGRVVPFGVGTSIMYNYLDYRFKNTSNQVFQLIVYTTDTYLCGEIRCEKALECTYHIKVENEYFSREAEGIYRNGEIYQDKIEKKTGNIIESIHIKTNHAKVMYNEKYINMPIREGDNLWRPQSIQ